MSSGVSWRFMWWIMRKICVLAVAMICSALVCEGQFFPKDSLDLRQDGFKAQWYSSQLRALQEPSLLAMAHNSASQSYRFLWLRSFHHPVAIRIDLKLDGSGILTTKVGSGAGGYSPGMLIKNTSRALTAKETSSFLAQVQTAGFWTAPNPVNDQKGTDGSQWIIEGVRDSKYHVVDRWSPKDGVAHNLGVLFAFDLAKLNVPPREIY